MNGPRRIAAVVPHDQVAVFVLVLVTAWVALAIMLIEPRIAAGHLFVPLLAALSGVSVLGLSALAVRWWSRANVDLPRSFARGLATLLAIVAYVGTISALILVLDHDAGIEMAFGITALAALAIEPFRRSLQQRLDALLFGEQDSAYRVITDLGRRLETTTLPEEMLPAVVDAVAGALDLPYVAIELDGRTGP
ncbi:MAG TPA: hypothetical protein VF183_01000, partial [Acidimicrobiales bacterium]